MSDRSHRPHQPCTPKEELQNLVEGICDDPFQEEMESTAAEKYDLATLKENLLNFAESYIDLRLPTKLGKALASSGDETNTGPDAARPPRKM